MVGWHLWLRPGNVIFAYNTNDNLSLIGVAFAARDLPTVRANVEKHHSSVIAQHAPELWERMQAGKRESRYVGGAIPSHVRKPERPCWDRPGCIRKSVHRRNQRRTRQESKSYWNHNHGCRNRYPGLLG